MPLDALAHQSGGRLKGVEGQNHELCVVPSGHDVSSSKAASNQGGQVADSLIGRRRTKFAAQILEIADLGGEKDQASSGFFGGAHGLGSQSAKAFAVVEARGWVAQQVGETFHGVSLDGG